MVVVVVSLGFGFAMRTGWDETPRRLASAAAIVLEVCRRGASLAEGGRIRCANY